MKKFYLAFVIAASLLAGFVAGEYVRERDCMMRKYQIDCTLQSFSLYRGTELISTFSYDGSEVGRKIVDDNGGE